MNTIGQGGALAGAALALQPQGGAAQSRGGELPAGPYGPGGRIVFDRADRDADGNLRGSRLYRVDADGSDITPLTPMTPGIHHGAASWSPDGGQVAYARIDTATGGSSIHVTDVAGAQDRALTSAGEDALSPAWGPGGRIAFLLRHEELDCLAVTDTRGGTPRQLFCPPLLSARGSRAQQPVWSADGAALFLESGYASLTTDLWYSSLHRIDVVTGAATLLVDELEMWAGPPGLAVAPNGRHVLYGDRIMGIFSIDFASGASTWLTEDGHAPLYSGDGRRVAFTRSVTDGGQRYDLLFVMDADGRNARALTTARVDTLEYRAVDWSRDGSLLLVNRTTQVQADGAPPVPRQALRLVNVATRGVAILPEGHAPAGGWFQQAPRTQALPG